MNWIGRFFTKGRLDAELNKELEYHLQRQLGDYVQAGLTEAEARRKVRLEFGGTEQISEACRDARGTRWLESIFEDLRFSGRLLRKSPSFTIAAILTLALGIGANTAIFRLLDAVRLRALPVKNPQQLVILQLADRTGMRGSLASPYAALTNPIWEQLRKTQQALWGVLAWGNNDFNIAPGGEAHLVHGLFVSGDFFSVLGVSPLKGRVFNAADDQRGCGVPGAVVSYSFWERQLGGDESVIGKRMTINFQKTEIIGVTPQGFFGPEVGRSYDVAVPICSQASLWDEGNWLDEGTTWWLTVIGRLHPGQSIGQANAQLSVASQALFRSTLPANYPPANSKDYLRFRLQAAPLSHGVSILRDQFGDSLLLLLATTGLVLLIACANLANLILARSTARKHEFALRLAVGASRRRLIQQLMTEALLITLCGVTAGLLLSELLSRLLIAQLSTQGDTLFLDLQTDWRIFAFTVVAATLTCIAFGLLPALQSTRADVADAIKTSGRTLSANRKQVGLRQILVVTQVSLSLVLLVGALLFSGTLRNLLAVETGFRQNGVLIENLDLSRLHIPVPQRSAFKEHLLERIRAVPGIVSAGEVAILPLSGGGWENVVWREDDVADTKFDCNFNWVGPGYLPTMGIPLVIGRDFDTHDTTSSPNVAIVNQSFARKMGLGANPIGQRFHREATPSQPEMAFQIIGLVKDTKYHNLRENLRPIVYLPAAQDTDPSPFTQVVTRSDMGFASITSGIRSAMNQENPSIGLTFQAFEDMVREGLVQERLMASLSGFFGVLAALISSVGLYGVMSYLMARRTNEIGIRIALGADRSKITGLILRQASLLLVPGILIGTLLAFALTGSARSLLFGLQPHDLRTIAYAAILLASVTLLASYLPARRAARTEPMTALREE